jgi:hypothetical protein
MTDMEFVRSKCPRAQCTAGKVKLFWPWQGTREKFIVVLAPHLSAPAGEGDTAEEAWQRAAEYVRRREERYASNPEKQDTK